MNVKFSRFLLDILRSKKNVGVITVFCYTEVSLRTCPFGQLMR